MNVNQSAVINCIWTYGDSPKYVWSVSCKQLSVWGDAISPLNQLVHWAIKPHLTYCYMALAHYTTLYSGLGTLHYNSQCSEICALCHVTKHTSQFES